MAESRMVSIAKGRLTLAGALACCLVATFGASPAGAQAITSADLQNFVAARAGFGQPVRNESNDWKDLLYLAAGSPSPEMAIEEFARRIGVAPDAARDYARVIIESAVDDETCQVEGPRPAHCAFSPGSPR